MIVCVSVREHEPRVDTSPNSLYNVTFDRGSVLLFSDYTSSGFVDNAMFSLLLYNVKQQ